MRRTGLILTASLVLLAGCDKGGGAAPTGQVVATADGQEITASELRMELGGASAKDPAGQKRLEAAALQSIVNRKLLAAAAREQKVDQAPEFAMQRAKADDLILIQAMERKLAGTVPAPSAEEVQRLIAEHPDSFAQRKLFTIDQVIAPGIPPAVTKEMVPLRTLPQVEALLQARKIPHQRAVGTLDGANADPSLVKKIAALPPGEVFVIPNGGGVVINQIRDVRVDPLVGPRATQLGQQMVRQRRTQEIVRKQMQDLITAGAGKVKYNAAYTPPAAPKPKA